MPGTRYEYDVICSVLTPIELNDQITPAFALVTIRKQFKQHASSVGCHHCFRGPAIRGKVLKGNWDGTLPGLVERHARVQVDTAHELPQRRGAEGDLVVALIEAEQVTVHT